MISIFDDIILCGDNRMLVFTVGNALLCALTPG